MAKGDVRRDATCIETELTLHDELPVTQVTVDGNLNFCQYFTHTSWNSDTCELIFTSDRSGSHEFYAFNPKTKDTTQLTEGANAVPFAWAIALDGSKLVYFGGNIPGKQEELHQLWLDSLKDEIMLERPEKYHGWSRSIISLAPDNDTFYVDGVADHSTLLPSNLFTGSLDQGIFTPVFSGKESKQNFFCHNMISPAEPALVQVNKSAEKYIGRDAPQRMWLLDTRTGALNPLYKHEKNFWGKHERVGHECWHPSGDFMVFVVRRDKVKACVVADGYSNDRAWTCGQGENFWHVSASPLGNMLCADTMWCDTGIWLIEFKKQEEGRLFNLCLSKSGWQTSIAKEMDNGTGALVQAHPHPGWSPDGKHVQFTSFRPAQRAVHLYLVEVPIDPFS
ncbi:hypothetical protein GF325_14985 [Candidatus Bathyarchaeota archaeon]|nr:hypothetical protein [Candidatus Bathyarchaeota archaeon]